eukprot:scaffold526756_cov36-Prasinocladus_malaysianus.AAC.1
MHREYLCPNRTIIARLTEYLCIVICVNVTQMPICSKGGHKSATQGRVGAKNASSMISIHLLKHTSHIMIPNP